MKIKIDVFNQNELKNLLYSKLENISNFRQEFNNLPNIIKYFNYWDYSTLQLDNSITFIVAHSENNILGIIKFGKYKLDMFSVCYISTNVNFRNNGISKLLIEMLFKYLKSINYSKSLDLTGYSIDGWKYLRKYILMHSELNSIKLVERPIEYVNEWNEENRILHTESLRILGHPIY